ncbi:serine/threonine protein phosphatase [Paracoccus sp. S-4012]|uniref:metallophosphoesterase n=1 Tax=Paracoccus sp. S-4012 TaxID=2665648 RepID=UPI0012AFB3E1|nr:metallophosphoesterase [Paracoccus sp. S-4012]MRX49496.1 serine/threonine protein phosphatase [Paracoccus sp. S-4012]
MRVYAVGDIHGQTPHLRVAHALIAADRRRCGDAGARVVHLGDLVAKGPDSRGTIELLMAGQAAGAPWLVLKGNHDRMFSLFLDDPEARDPGMQSEGRWIDPENGGDVVLESYALRDPAGRPLAEVHAEAVAAVPQAQRDWLAALPGWHLTPLALFVHAGIRPGVDLQAQDETDLLWIRKPFQTDTRDHGVLVVHGHTPHRQVRHHGNRLNIDTDAASGGPVSAVVIEAEGVFLLTEDGRKEVRP